MEICLTENGKAYAKQLLDYLEYSKINGIYSGTYEDLSILGNYIVVLKHLERNIDFGL